MNLRDCLAQIASLSSTVIEVSVSAARITASADKTQVAASSMAGAVEELSA